MLRALRPQKPSKVRTPRRSRFPIPGPTEPSPAQPPSLTILIVDDDACAAEELAEFVTAQVDACSILADSAAAARQRRTDGPTPDVCLVDIRMPRESGLGLVSPLRDDQPATRLP